MNRTDRLLAIVLELQRKKHGGCRAIDLAKTFEVSQRTIYRDMLALREIGVPIYTANREGYALVEGYFLPPLSFTNEEALSIALGNEYVAKIFDDQFHTAADSAYRKVDVLLQESQRDQINRIKSQLDIEHPQPPSQKALVHLQKLRIALIEQKKVRLSYSRWDKQTGIPIKTAREISPQKLAHTVDDWYLIAYCHLRKANRIFRLSRIEQVEILQTPFELSRKESHMDETTCEDSLFIRALLEPAIIPWIKESNKCTILDEEWISDGLVVTLITYEKLGVTGWLLGYGGNIHVLEPEWLQAEMKEQAENILRKYDPIPA